jgi:hypothetical protein
MMAAQLVLVVGNGARQLIGRVPNSFVLRDLHTEGDRLGAGMSSYGTDRSNRDKSRSVLFCVDLGHFVVFGG